MKKPLPVKPDNAPTCLMCTGWTGALQRYEHDGKTDYFHDTCVGGWLMRNVDSVISFVQGTAEVTA
jgi:hypothetical protein